MREAAHGVDGLVGQIVSGGGVVLYQLSVLGVVARPDVVDLLVDLGTVMVSLLTGTGNRELDSGRMPGSDTSDLAKTLVRLTWQLLGVPTRGHACKTSLIVKLPKAKRVGTPDILISQPRVDFPMLIKCRKSAKNLSVHQVFKENEFHRSTHP